MEFVQFGPVAVPPNFVVFLLLVQHIAGTDSTQAEVNRVVGFTGIIDPFVPANLLWENLAYIVLGKIGFTVHSPVQHQVIHHSTKIHIFDIQIPADPGS